MAEKIEIVMKVDTKEGWLDPPHSSDPPRFAYTLRWLLKHPRSIQGCCVDSLMESRVRIKGPMFNETMMRDGFLKDQLVPELVETLSKRTMGHLVEVESFLDNYWGDESTPEHGSLMVDADGNQVIITFDSIYILPIVDGERLDPVYVCPAVVEHWIEEKEQVSMFMDKLAFPYGDQLKLAS